MGLLALQLVMFCERKPSVKIFQIYQINIFFHSFFIIDILHFILKKILFGQSLWKCLSWESLIQITPEATEFQRNFRETFDQRKDWWLQINIDFRIKALWQTYLQVDWIICKGCDILFLGQNSSHSEETSFVCPTKSLIAGGPPCQNLQSVPIENIKHKL